MRPQATALLALLALAACGSGAAAPACQGLQVRQAWIADAPPVAAVRVGYASLENSAAQALVIDAVDSADFGSVEPHEMAMVDGIMQMRPLAQLRIPAHGKLELAPEGKHLMLMNPRRSLKPGDSSVLSFRCGKQAVQARFDVRAAP